MAKRDELHALIKALTPREKAYFKRFCKRADEGGKQQYLLVFEALDRMAAYDEADLRKRLKGQVNLRRLSAERRYLYDQLLRSLDQYTLRNHQGRQIEGLRREAELLAERGLLEAAHRRLKKALDIVERTEDFERHLLLLQLQIRIYELQAKGQLTETIRSINRKREAIRAKQSNLDAYYALRFEVFDVQHQYGQIGSGKPCPELESLEAHPLLVHPENAQSIRACERRYYAINLMRCIRKEYRTWYTEYGHYVDFMEAHEAVFVRSNFLQLYNNYLYACIVVQDEGAFWKTVEKLRARLTDSDPNHRCMMESRILDFYSQTGQLAEGLAYWRGLPWQDERLFERADAFWQLALYRAMVELLLLSGQAGAVLDLQPYRPGGELMQRMGNTYFVDDLLLMLAHLGLGHYRVVESLLRSLHRHLQKANNLGPFQRCMLAFLRRLSLQQPLPEIRQQMTDLLVELEALARDPDRNFFMHFFPFTAWLRHRLEPDRPLGPMVRSAYRHFHQPQPVDA